MVESSESLSMTHQATHQGEPMRQGNSLNHTCCGSKPHKAFIPKAHRKALLVKFVVMSCYNGTRLGPGSELNA